MGNIVPITVKWVALTPCSRDCQAPLIRNMVGAVIFSLVASIHWANFVMEWLAGLDEPVVEPLTYAREIWQ